MKKVCVITGGGSGIGLATAHAMPKADIIVIAGRTFSKLESAAEALRDAGYEVYPYTCDTSSRESVRALAEYAVSLGAIVTVINAAGLSPAMADPEMLLRVNALGTVYVNEEFSKVMENGSVIVDISSNSAYLLPAALSSKRLYSWAEKNEKRFLRIIKGMSALLPTKYMRAGLAYAYSKNFVLWYARKSAFVYSDKGIRVVSVSPGLIDTGMGQLEAKESTRLLKKSAIPRMGRAEELGFAIASVADPRNSYLAGVDILCDGGSVAARTV